MATILCTIGVYNSIHYNRIKLKVFTLQKPKNFDKRRYLVVFDEC